MQVYNNKKPRQYWSDLKHKLINEENNRFLNKFKQVHKNSFNEYSTLEDEIVI